MTATEPTIHFQGRSVGFREGCMFFFVVGLMWRMDGKDINCMYFFCCKVDRVATFESACPSLCKEINWTESICIGVSDLQCI